MLRLLLLATFAGSAIAGDFTVSIRPRQTNNYPPALAVPTAAETPKEWLDALQAATAAGKIPNIAPAMNQGGNIVYANNVGFDQATCSWTVTKCVSKNDIVNAPDNHMAIGFDDGPTSKSDDLYSFLNQYNQSATHFMIGSNVLSYPQQFSHAVKEGNQHFAVHTWSHQLCTTLTNQQVVAELGWTMQIIADYSGGYIPKFWRPPQGDVDNRVRAIAEEIFGLTNVLWNHDTNDWCLNDQGGSECPNVDPGKDVASVAAAVQSGIHGAKSPGLIMLEHELTHASIKIFKDYYPSIKGLGWTPGNVADLFNMPWYKNAWNNQSPALNGTVLQTFTLESSDANDTSSSTSSARAPSTSAASTTPSSSIQAHVSTSNSAKGSTRAQGTTAAFTSPTSSLSKGSSTSGASTFAPGGSLGFAGLAFVAIIAANLL
ncbi:related to CDA2 - sporulation-specific chitin deacetylase [Melanopsichium pennsylvanicum]|uniref:Chitin deacetylase 3 n=2 Tax=Melanopsichium pennsylvanicum TaxID=63383 RepID=A0AAJ4XHS3_9BASI|nr:related to CDA2-sporulation-specific chitin deacetylase [Melanopsichium pennsylvanicum 4]SNX81971.1 related to CDA2 - sporulation-specific chitin deacetylase [Melanopsichium pennsylvanicum]